MKIDTRTLDRIAVLEIEGTVDLYEGYNLRDEVRKLLHQGLKYLVFDCRAVDYVDSTGLGIFVHSREMAHEVNGNVALVSPGPAFRKVLTTTQLDRLLLIHETVEEAVDFFQT